MLMNKRKIMKRIAKEWLYLFGFLAFGFFVVPVIIFFVFGPTVETTTLSKSYSNFHDALYEKWGGGVDFWFALSSVLFPYLLFQFTRSIIWARKMLRTR